MSKASMQLAQLLVELKNTTKSTSLPFSSPLIQVRQTTADLKLIVKVLAFVAERRGPSPYKAPPNNLIVTPQQWLTNSIGSWSEFTYTTAPTGTTGIVLAADDWEKLKYEYGVIDGLHLEVTSATVPGSRGRKLTGIAVTANTLHSMEFWQARYLDQVDMMTLTLRYNTGDIQTWTYAGSTTPSRPVLTQILGFTTPVGVSTVDIEISLDMMGDTSIGQAWLCLPMLIVGSTIEPWITRIVAGEFTAP